MSVERYLVGIEQLEYALFKQVEALESYSFKEAKTASRKRYLFLYTIGFLTYLSTIVRTLIHTAKNIILTWMSSHEARPVNKSVNRQNRVHQVSPQGPPFSRGIEAMISSLTGSDQMYRHQLFHGEYMIATASAGLVTTEGFELITIPDSLNLAPVTIRIKLLSGQVGLSKLIFQSSNKHSIRVYRRFGTDEIPVKPSENINVSTDRITIGDTVSVRFSQELVRARSAPVQQ